MKKALILLAVIILASPVSAAIRTTAAEGALQMTLTYDLSSGNTTLTNTTGSPLNVDLYEIWSAGGHLSTTGWASIADTVAVNPMSVMGELGVGALSFGEIVANTGLLAEGSISSTATFQADDPWSIGQPIAAGTGMDDLSFYYTKPGVVGDKFLGQIVVVPEPATMSLLAMGVLGVVIRRKR